MGDRGNVKITDTTDQAFGFGVKGIFVYSHWAGSELPERVRDALKAGEDRWGDPTYLTRILIDQITKDGRDQTTGFGVGLEAGEGPVVTVDIGKETVEVQGVVTPFAEYVKKT